MIRVHQFNKVEQFSLTKPEGSWDEHEFLLANSEELVRELDVPYRVVVLPAGDISSAAAKTYDVEIRFPSQGRYRETGSVSNTTDFQARRLGIRYRGERGLEPVHTLNGTAVVDRMALAVLENFGGEVPEVLGVTGHLNESHANVVAGGVPERSNGAVLKTAARSNPGRGFESHPPPLVCLISRGQGAAPLRKPLGLECWRRTESLPDQECDRHRYRQRKDPDDSEGDLRDLAAESEWLVGHEEHGEDDGDGGKEDLQLTELLAARTARADNDRRECPDCR